jgi:hypothetical protein
MLNLFKGWLGEKETQFGMWAKLDGNDYRRFHNVIFTTFNGTTQVDHILLSRYGIFVIETKNINGWIFGNERSKQWTQSLYGKKYKFQNPMHQNYKHTKAVANFLDIDHDSIHSIIFFIGDSVSLKTELPKNVMTSGLSSYIKSFEQRVFSGAEVTAFVNKIEILKEGNISGREHVANLKSRFSDNTICPKCGKSLVKRTARNGLHAGNQFLGCSGFPDCKYSRGV